MAKPRPTKRTQPSRPVRGPKGPARDRSTGPGEPGAPAQHQHGPAWNRGPAPTRGFNPGFKRR